MACICGATEGLQTCSSCKQVKYCSTACQIQAWEGHKAECKFNTALAKGIEECEAAVISSSEKLEAALAAEALLPPDPPRASGAICVIATPRMAASGQRFSATMATENARLYLKSWLPLLTPASASAVMCVRMSGIQKAEQVWVERSDPVFTKGELSPVLALCGIPLYIVRTREGLQRLPRTAELDNQAATYFMIPPCDGGAFAPGEWQWNIGEVTLYRRDQKHLTLPHFYHLWDFFSTMLDEESGRKKHYSPKGFLRWGRERMDGFEANLNGMW